MIMTGHLIAWTQNWKSNILHLRLKIYSLKLPDSHLFLIIASNDYEIDDVVNIGIKGFYQQ